MKKSIVAVGLMLVLPAMAVAAPKLSLSWGGIGTTPDTSNTTTHSIDRDAITAGTLAAGGWSFWLNVVLDQDDQVGLVGAFGAGLDVNAPGLEQFYIRSVQTAQYDMSGDEDWVSGWDPNGAPVGTLIGQRFAGNELANIGLTSAVKVGGEAVNPPQAVFPVVESIRIRMYQTAPEEVFQISIVDPGGGLNWGCMTGSVPSGSTTIGGAFGPGDVTGFTITPEPVSLMLLAVGGLFLRRRMA